MKVLTPEIAWHETLPIYSCDLQPFTPVRRIHESQLHEPLAEIHLSSTTPADSELLKGGITTATADECEKMEDVFGETWTRLATAGGDSTVRLWRVNLDWRPPGSVIVTTFKKPLPKGMLQGSIGSDSKKTASGSVVTLSTGPTVAGSSNASGGVKVSAPVSEGLVFLATLKRHELLVNIVRWSPSGRYLASGGDDQCIIIWHMQPESESKTAPLNVSGDYVDEPKRLENWQPLRSLRNHLAEVYDLCWSPDETSLISGSVDQSVVLWSFDLSTDGASAGACKSVRLRDHKHYVQGVAWDPLGVFVASLSSDRSCRIYKVATQQCVATLSKVDKFHLFQDDSWKSFFRRPAFSPDGMLFICPAGNLETAPFAGDMSSAVSSTTNKSASIAAEVDALDYDVTICSTTAPQHAAHIFLRNWSKKPCVSLPTGPRPVIVARFCPQPFQLRATNSEPEAAFSSLFSFPYRWIFCLLLDGGLLFYDTQQSQPFAQIGQIHYQSLNDVAWSSDGRLVTVTSTDGYCSLIHFSVQELGTPYRGPLKERVISPAFNSSSADLSLSKADDETENPIIEQAVVTILRDKKPQVKAAEALKSEGRRHISFELGVGTGLPERPHIPLPVTPNTGRYLSTNIVASPMAMTPITAAPTQEGNKRRIQFTTLSKEIEPKPPMTLHTKEENQNQDKNQEVYEETE